HRPLQPQSSPCRPPCPTSPHDRMTDEWYRGKPTPFEGERVWLASRLVMRVADHGGVILATAAVAYRWPPGIRQWAIPFFLEETGELWSPASNHHRPKSPTRRGRLQP